MSQIASSIPQPRTGQAPSVPHGDCASVPATARALTAAPEAGPVDSSAWANWRPALGAQLVSLLLHGALVFNAAMFEFHRPLVTRDADLKVARGEVPVQVTLVLEPEVKLVDQTEPLPPVPEPPPAEVPEVPPVPPVPPVPEPPVPPTPPVPPEPPVEPPQVVEADPVVEPEPATEIEAPGAGPAVVKQDEPPPVTEPVKPVEVAVQPQPKPQDKPQVTPEVKPEVKPVEVVLATPVKPVTEPVLIPPVKPAPVTPVAPQPTAPAKVGAKTGADIEMAVPVYSMLSQRAGEEGVLILEIEILASGKIGFIRILESPGYERLEKSAIAAVRRSKVQPALIDGRPVREVIVRSIRFRRR